MMMTRSLILASLVVSLAACTAFGAPSIFLTRGDIGERAFVDRREVDLRPIFRGLDGLSVSGPDAGFEVGAQRLQLSWTAHVTDPPMGIPAGVHVLIVGTPIINAARNGIDLADARVEEVKLSPLPIPFNIGLTRASPGESLGTLPLLMFSREELVRNGVVYEPARVSIGTLGLRVELAPK